MSLFIPTFYSKDIFNVPTSFYQKIGIKYLLCDLDNTLDAFDTLYPSDRVFKLKEQLEQIGITMFIISNNKSNRVSKYAEALGIGYLNSARKPFKKRLVLFLKNQNIDLNEVLLVGDQLLTDVRCGRSAKIKILLTDPIVKREQPTTYINRTIDRPIRYVMRKRGILRKIEVSKDE